MWYRLNINNITKNSELVQISVTKNWTIRISRINRFLKIVLLSILRGTKRKLRWKSLRLVAFILNVSYLSSIDSSDETCGPRHIYLSLLFLSCLSLFFVCCFFFTWVSITFRDFRHALRNRAKTRVVKTMLWNHAWSGQLDFHSKWNVKKKLSIKSMETLPLTFSYIFKLSGDLFCHVTKTWRRLAVLA